MSLDIDFGMENEISKCDSEVVPIGVPMSLSMNGNGTLHFDHQKSIHSEEMSSSPDTSTASTPLNGSLIDDGFSSCGEDRDAHEILNDDFIKTYVSLLFNTMCDISYEEKARFGELMKNSAARISFAKYIDAQRSQVKCVDETTFYKLLHSFALVLFECGEADDYMPGKTLMNMAFTYYYVPDQKQVCADKLSLPESLSSTGSSEEKSDGNKSRTSSESSKFSLKQRFLREVEACKQVFQDTPSFQELKQGIWKGRKPSQQDDNSSSSSGKISRSVSCSSVIAHPDVYSPSKKNFLYEHLKSQVIWKSLRFWNAAFFTAVHAERKRRCSQNDWASLSADEQDSTNTAIVNITFGQLGTFINNMKCLGLSNETCYEFLRKQSVIGGIPEDGQYYKMLEEQIEDEYTF